MNNQENGHYKMYIMKKEMLLFKIEGNPVIEGELGKNELDEKNFRMARTLKKQLVDNNQEKH